METTAELRWFAPGRPPALLDHRMDELGAEGPERRRDLYLCLPETEALGVKLRDGGAALELKLREQVLGEVEFGAGALASPEVWQKWSFPLQKESLLGLPADVWLSVDKARRLAGYNQCGVELTELRAAGAEWWTVGFEASGGRPVQALTEAVADFFREPATAESVRAARCCAYPAWLRALASCAK